MSDTDPSIIENPTPEPQDASGPGCAGVAGSASDLLRQWKENCEARDREIERDSWAYGPPGIERAVGELRADLNMAMWFVDETLKLLAAQEASKPNAKISNPDPLNHD